MTTALDSEIDSKGSCNMGEGKRKEGKGKVQGFRQPGLGDVPAHGRGGGMGGTCWSLRSLPIQTILGLFDSLKRIL